MLSFPDVFDLLSNEFSSLRRGSLTFTRVPPGSFNGLLLWGLLFWGLLFWHGYLYETLIASVVPLASSTSIRARAAHPLPSCAARYGIPARNVLLTQYDSKTENRTISFVLKKKRSKNRKTSDRKSVV